MNKRMKALNNGLTRSQREAMSDVAIIIGSTFLCLVSLYQLATLIMEIYRRYHGN